MQYNLEDVVMVKTKCEKCGVEGQAPTFKQILENKESILTKMLETKGHADILCVDCAAVAVEKHKEATE
jgi:hypothetical protein